MNRELTELEKQQLEEVIEQLSWHLVGIKNRFENKILIENRPIRFVIQFVKYKKEDNKLYLLQELGFDFEKYIFSRPILSCRDHLWMADNTSKLDLFVENDDTSGAIIECDDGFTYKKDYITIFGVKLIIKGKNE